MVTNPPPDNVRTKIQNRKNHDRNVKRIDDARIENAVRPFQNLVFPIGFIWFQTNLACLGVEPINQRLPFE